MPRRAVTRASEARAALFGAVTAVAVLGGFAPATAHAGDDPTRARFRDIYRELVDTDTSFPDGSCTEASRQLAARLRAAGLPETDIRPFAAAEHPREGGLVATLPGSDTHRKALLLVAHLDVVGVRREEWRRDPFHLVEEDGFFYGRGVSDDKAMAATLVDALIRLRERRVPLARGVTIALTCGEETATAFNGANYLANAQRAWIDAELALVPSGGGRLDAAGHPLSIGIQAGEKVQQNFELLANAAGGHSSRPVPNGAVERLARALVRLEQHEFPLETTPITRAYFRAIAAEATPAERAAIDTLLADPADAAAARRVAAADPGWNAVLRTTCATTRIEAGEALNALPQRARATVNCRLLPGRSIAELEATLAHVVDDPTVLISHLGPKSPTPPAPPLSPAVLDPIARVAEHIWPGVGLVPSLLTGATDARHFNAVGIPTYGVTAVFNDPDGDGVHGANERVRTASVYAGREFVYELIVRLAGPEPPTP